MEKPGDAGLFGAGDDLGLAAGGAGDAFEVVDGLFAAFVFEGLVEDGVEADGLAGGAFDGKDLFTTNLRLQVKGRYRPFEVTYPTGITHDRHDFIRCAINGVIKLHGILTTNISGSLGYFRSHCTRGFPKNSIWIPLGIVPRTVIASEQDLSILENGYQKIIITNSPTGSAVISCFNRRLANKAQNIRRFQGDLRSFDWKGLHT
jgi:hypothetical protein